MKRLIGSVSQRSFSKRLLQSYTAGETARAAAHFINNQLLVIMGRAALLTEKLNDQTAQNSKASISHAVDQIKLAITDIQNILHCHEDAEELESHFALKVIKETLQYMRLRTESANVKIEIDEESLKNTMWNHASLDLKLVAFHFVGLALTIQEANLDPLTIKIRGVQDAKIIFEINFGTADAMLSSLIENHESFLDSLAAESRLKIECRHDGDQILWTLDCPEGENS